MIQNSYDDSPSLFLVPTPIGNMEDITFRALNVLSSVDAIFCEDTRETLKLLNHFNISKKLISCHEYNENSIKKLVVELLKKGQNIALVTDQGTPIISDPGFCVASYVISCGYNVVSLPGATAFVPALTSSGISPSRFLFYGFLNSKSSKLKKELESLKNFEHTMIFYESPHRLLDTLKYMYEIFGERHVCVCRELSKVYEEYCRGSLSDIFNNINVIKGEFVIVVEGNTSTRIYDDLTIVEHVNLYVEDGMDIKAAIKQVSVERNLPKSVVYNEYHRR